MKSPVLFLTYRRFETTISVFESIRQARPTRIYFASNGADPNSPNDELAVEKVRGLIALIDWPCEVKTRFLSTHLSVKDSINSSVDWFFEQEESGIILEDDCKPHIDFFRFCDELLEKYKTEEKIWAISGHNFQNNIKRGDATYYFSKHNHVWGWASWRRAWQRHDKVLAFWPDWKKSYEWRRFWPTLPSRMYWTFILEKTYKNRFNTWDYAWSANIWFNNGLTIIPNVNLISNIGFGATATHTKSDRDPFANCPVQGLKFVTHPNSIESNIEADQYTFDKHYSKGLFSFPQNILILPIKIFKYIWKDILYFVNFIVNKFKNKL